MRLDQFIGCLFKVQLSADQLLSKWRGQQGKDDVVGNLGGIEIFQSHEFSCALCESNQRSAKPKCNEARLWLGSWAGFITN